MSRVAEDIFARLLLANDVQELIARQEPERLHLDFKSEPQPKDFDHMLAKALSGFANADGGVIVVGVKDENGALSDKPLTNAIEFERHANEQLSRLVAFPIPGVQTKSLVLSSGPAGYVVILVPASDLAPHRSQKDRTYYRRSGDSQIPMEHYEVADMFGRRHHPVLEIAYRIAPAHRVGDNTQHLRVVVAITNLGRAVAQWPFLAMRIDSPNNVQEVEGLGLKPLTAGDNAEYQQFGSLGDVVIYPEMTLDAARIKIAVHLPNGQAGQKDLRIKYTISADGAPSIRDTLVVTAEEIWRSCNAS